MTNHQPIVLERVYNAPIEKIWAALTDKDLMKQWYFNVPDFKPEVGCEFNFFAGEDGKEYNHLCRGTAVVPYKKIAYTWRYEGWEGDSEVSFELTELADGKTKLVLTHAGLETFPADRNPDLRKSNFEGGWGHFVNVGLPGFVE